MRWDLFMEERVKDSQGKRHEEGGYRKDLGGRRRKQWVAKGVNWKCREFSGRAATRSETLWLARWHWHSKTLVFQVHYSLCIGCGFWNIIGTMIYTLCIDSVLCLLVCRAIKVSVVFILRWFLQGLMAYRRHFGVKKKPHKRKKNRYTISSDCSRHHDIPLNFILFFHVFPSPAKTKTNA